MKGELSMKETKKRKSARTALVAAGLAAVMAVTAMAAGPAIGDALRAALGSFVPYSQPLTGAVEAQGFRFEVLSALTDANNAVIYAQLTDLTGDRLAAAEVGGQLELPLEGEIGCSYGCSIVSYDPETRTALLNFHKDAGVMIPNGSEGELVLYSVQPGYHWFSGGEPIPLEGLTTDPVPSRTLPTGETVLSPGEYDIPERRELPLPDGDGAALAAVGFAADGRFHTLFRLPQGAVKGIVHAVPRAQPEEGRQNPFWGATKGESGRSEFAQDGSYDMDTVFFTLGDDSYCDVSYVRRPGGPELPEYLEPPYGLYMTEAKIKFEEPLRLPVKLSVVEAVSSPLSGLIDHNTLQELRLSPVGVSLLSTSPDYTQIGNYPLTVFLSDGTSFHPEAGIYGFQLDGPNTARWVFDRPVEVDQITGVALGAWMIPVENGTAGEGYWLPELPQ